MNSFTIFFETSTPKEAVTTNAPDILSLSPDVLLTPRGGEDVPVPYSVFADMSDGIGLSATVRFNSQKVFTREAYIPYTQGGELGTGGGVMSCTQGDRTQPLSWPMSESVFVNGNRVMRYFDIANMNAGNTIGEISLVRETQSGMHSGFSVEGVPEPAGFIDAVGDTAEALEESVSQGPSRETLPPLDIPTITEDENGNVVPATVPPIEDAEKPSTSQIPPEPTYAPSTPTSPNYPDNNNSSIMDTLASCLDQHNMGFRGGRIVFLAVAGAIFVVSLPTASTGAIILASLYFADDAQTYLREINSGEAQRTGRETAVEEIAELLQLSPGEVQIAGDIANMSSIFAGNGVLGEFSADDLFESILTQQFLEDLKTTLPQPDGLDPQKYPEEFIEAITRDPSLYPQPLDVFGDLDSSSDIAVQQKASKTWKDGLVGNCALVPIATPAHNVHIPK